MVLQSDASLSMVELHTLCFFPLNGLMDGLLDYRSPLMEGGWTWFEGGMLSFLKRAVD